MNNPQSESTEGTQNKSQIKKMWAKLSDEEISKASEDLDELIKPLQEKYGYSEEEAKQELESFKSEN